ncbi:MAG: hypothetical protein R2827_00980 [Bdellovibrionales bacterium]
MKRSFHMKFPHLTPGYCGDQDSGSLTLNAQFFALYFQRIGGGSEKLLFPQRVPRAGFFQELIDRETNVASQALRNARQRLKDEFSEIISSQSWGKLHNSTHALLRWGAF